MQKLNLQKAIRIVAVLIFVIGIFIGCDLGNKMVVVNQEVQYMFDWGLAVLVWFAGFAIALLFFGIARIIGILEKDG